MPEPLQACWWVVGIPVLCLECGTKEKGTTNNGSHSLPTWHPQGSQDSKAYQKAVPLLLPFGLSHILPTHTSYLCLPCSEREYVNTFQVYTMKMHLLLFRNNYAEIYVVHKSNLKWRACCCRGLTITWQCLNNVAKPDLFKKKKNRYIRFP